MNDMMRAILLIIIDALCAKRLGCYGSNAHLTPNIDRLSKMGVLFERAFSCTNATDPSMTTILTGMHPLSHGVIRHGSHVDVEDLKYLSYLIPLPRFLRRYGYRTIAIDWLGRWHKRGFDVYFSPTANDVGFLQLLYSIINQLNSLRYASKPKRLSSILRFSQYLASLSWQIGKRLIFDASKVTQLTINLLKRMITRGKNEKIFLLIHYWDTHAPYLAPQSVALKSLLAPTLSSLRALGVTRRKIMEVIADIIMERYFLALKSIDNNIGSLVNFLDAEGLLDETIIALTSDHGESLIEHGIFFDHHGLYEPTIHVPLIITAPNLPKNVRVKAIVQHIDLMPTLLSLIGFRPIYCDGSSLLPLIASQTSRERNLRSYALMVETYRQFKLAIRTERYKYIESPSLKAAICKSCGHVHGGVRELYDLIEDPKEEVNLVQSKSEIASMLSTLLREVTSLYMTRREQLRKLFMKNIKLLVSRNI